MVNRAQSGVSGTTPGSPYARAPKKTTLTYATYATRRRKRVADQDLHLWPDLAFKCDVCGKPIDKVTYPVHPVCEVAP